MTEAEVQNPKWRCGSGTHNHGIVAESNQLFATVQNFATVSCQMLNSTKENVLHWAVPLWTKEFSCWGIGIGGLETPDVLTDHLLTHVRCFTVCKIISHFSGCQFFS